MIQLSLLKQYFFKLIGLFILWFAGVQELILLTYFLLFIHWCIDLYSFYRCKEFCKELWNDITKPITIKIIFYSLLAIVVNAIQLHFFKDDLDVRRIILGLPIMSETLHIVTKIELYTGVKIVSTLKRLFNRFFVSITPKEDK